MSRNSRNPNARDDRELTPVIEDKGANVPADVVGVQATGAQPRRQDLCVMHNDHAGSSAKKFPRRHFKRK